MADTVTPARLVWDQDGARYYEMGTRMGVVYLRSDDGTYPEGVAWSGLTAVEDNPDGAEVKKLYANDSDYLAMRSRENAKGTIKGYTYPDVFRACEGSVEAAPGVFVGQQSRKPFGMCWRTVLGNDTQFDDFGYTLHIRYNCTVSPSQKAYASMNDDPDAIEFSWDYEATSIAIAGYDNSACLDIPSNKANAEKLKELEDILYGSSTAVARLPLPAEIFEMMKIAA